ncbi:MAG: alpha/beta hydrolase [Myxococcaceae bacterium]|nr:alpha/beta hydrolase [Myxococcaceae bacterium]
MRSAAGRSFSFWAVGLAAMGVLGCEQTGGGDGTPDAGQVSAEVQACRDGMDAKRAQLQAEGVNIANWSIEDTTEMAEITTAAPQTVETYTQYDGRYRPLSNHPGCDATNLYYDKANTQGSTPYVDGNKDGKWTSATAFGPNVATGFTDGNKANIPGYTCAAKEYTQPNEDTSKPIIILVHGNSTRPHTWEKFQLPPGSTVTSFENTQFTPDATAREQLADKLIAARYRVIAVDFRTDKVTAAIEPMANNTTENQAGNIDHGWSTPILQNLIKAVMKQNPTRKVSLVAHSLGVTVARDALRRIYVEYTKAPTSAETINPFKQLQHVILGSGANHGVSTYDAPYNLCGPNDSMRGTIVCEMGSRSNYTQTAFAKPLDGPKDLFATPCADGDYAFGKTGQCGDNVVKYFTVTMQDVQSGANYQDLYVSEAASRIDMPGCVTNKLTTLTDYDTSGYFIKGAIANHFGSMRSEAGMALVMEYLTK